VSWFRVNRGRLEYAGRITRGPFTRWADTPEGREAVARVARGIRFSLLGRSRSARKRMWRALEQATQTGLAAALNAEATRYMQLLASLAYADALPRAHVALHRLVLTPRAMIAGRAHAAISERLGHAPELAGMDAAVRTFFLQQLVVEMDAAIQKAAPSVKHPVEAHDGWACVGVRIGTVWVDPLWGGRDGTGHVFLFEFPRAAMPRRDRKALEQAIDDMAESVTSLSRLQRTALVRSASYR
jgi:hypothetical protein